VRSLADPTISLRRCQTDAITLLPNHGADDIRARRAWVKTG